MAWETKIMIAGIVGSEEAKFTDKGKENALFYIRSIVRDPTVTEIVSGACHLGGIDIWAVEEAKKEGKETTEFWPTGHYWSTGFKPRNIQIAKRSDIVYCITVDKLPNNYKGMRFEGCYHCENNEGVLRHPDHVKSGGCWTMHYAMRKLGKKGILIVVNN